MSEKDPIKKPKRYFCDCCGEEIFGGWFSLGEFKSCGKSECEKVARDEERAAYERREEAARDDEFNRY